jgi:GxxExxY protein
MLRIKSPFPKHTEHLTSEVLDAAMEVHKRLGAGFLEATYVDALTIEFEFRGLSFERERAVLLTYRDKPLRTHRLDLVVEGEILVEVKSVERLAPVHHAQVLSYLRASELRLAFLLNFNSAVLKSQLRRIVL